MHRLVLLFALLLGLHAAAQQINENSVVKDSSGQEYPAAIWRQLLMKGGHVLKPENKNDPNTAYVIVRLSDEQREARLAKMPAPKESKFFRNGDKINLGKVTAIDGKKIDLKDNTGKITVINFWFVNCPPCRMEIPELNTLVDKYASDSVRFVAVALDDKYALENFLKLLPFNYSIVDGGRYIADRYNITSYPTHVILNREGKVAFHTTGLSTNTVYWLEKTIRELLNKPEAVTASAK